MNSEANPDQSPQPGDLVQSLAGHDRGKLYLVKEEAGNRLLLTDGAIRPWAKPKAKSPRHCRLIKKKTEVWPQILDRITEGSQDARIREYLQSAAEELNQQKLKSQ